MCSPLREVACTSITGSTGSWQDFRRRRLCQPDTGEEQQDHVGSRIHGVAYVQIAGASSPRGDKGLAICTRCSHLPPQLARLHFAPASQLPTHTWLVLSVPLSRLSCKPGAGSASGFGRGLSVTKRCFFDPRRPPPHPPSFHFQQATAPRPHTLTLPSRPHATLSTTPSFHTRHLPPIADQLEPRSRLRWRQQTVTEEPLNSGTALEDRAREPVRMEGSGGGRDGGQRRPSWLDRRQSNKVSSHALQPRRDHFELTSTLSGPSAPCPPPIATTRPIRYSFLPITTLITTTSILRAGDGCTHIPNGRARGGYTIPVTAWISGGR